jgi:hypothetical protein
MQAGISPLRFHEALIVELFPYLPSDEEILCAMILLHTCNLKLTSAARVEGGATGFEGLTAMAAAEVVAVLFEQHDDVRSRGGYWYQQWNDRWNAYALIESIPERLRPTLRRVQSTFEHHPWIARLDDDGWELFS